MTRTRTKEILTLTTTTDDDDDDETSFLLNNCIFLLDLFYRSYFDVKKCSFLASFFVQKMLLFFCFLNYLYEKKATAPPGSFLTNLEKKEKTIFYDLFFMKYPVNIFFCVTKDKLTFYKIYPPPRP